MAFLTWFSDMILSSLLTSLSCLSDFYDLIRSKNLLSNCGNWACSAKFRTFVFVPNSLESFSWSDYTVAAPDVVFKIIRQRFSNIWKSNELLQKKDISLWEDNKISPRCYKWVGGIECYPDAINNSASRNDPSGYSTAHKLPEEEKISFSWRQRSEVQNVLPCFPNCFASLSSHQMSCLFLKYGFSIHESIRTGDLHKAIMS